MKRYVIALVLLTGLLPAYALDISDTYPLPNTESFEASDTLELGFDSPPDGVLPEHVTIQGERVAYGVDFIALAPGNRLRILPRLHWLAGDRVTVIVHSPLMTSPFAFSFWVHVPLGRFGDTTWSESLTLDYNGAPRAIVVADFDGDVAVDIGVVYAEQLVVTRNRVLEGILPLFDPAAPSWSAPDASVDERRVLRAGDLDGDGRMDLASLTFNPNTIRIFRNNSTSPTIEFVPDEFLVVHATSLLDMQLGDVSGDGKPDLIVAGVSPEDVDHDSLIVYVNSSVVDDIRFDTRVSYVVGNGPSRIQICDFDRDHALDLVVSCVSARSVDAFYAPRTNPLAFTRQTILTPLELESGPDGLVVVNTLAQGDPAGELPDLAVWSAGLHSAFRRGGELDQDPFLLRFRNNGDRTFDPVGVGFPGWNAGRAPLAVTCADLDRETPVDAGDRDWIIAGRSSGDRTLFWYDEDPASVLQVPFTLPQPLTAESGDLDLDGDVDLVLIDLPTDNERVVCFFNPDHRADSGAVLEFNTVAIDGDTAVAGIVLINNDVYPATLQALNTTNLLPPFGLVGVFLPGDSTPLPLPYEVRVGERFEVRCWFLPDDTSRYGSSLNIEYRGRQPRMLPVRGTGGRSSLGILDRPAGVMRDTLFFGNFEAGGTMTRPFWMNNYGNYVLDGRFLPVPLTWFEADTLADSLERYSRGRDHDVIYTAPQVPDELVCIDSVMIEDYRFHYADALTHYPRNELTRDTATIVFIARVLQNRMPTMECPGDSVCEGEVGLFVIPLQDPNAPGEPVVCRYLYQSTGTALEIQPDPEDFTFMARDILELDYTVADSVSPLGEQCTFYVEVQDYDFPDRRDTLECIVSICPFDDPPTIVPVDTTVYELTDLTGLVLGRGSDEEGEILGCSARWVDPCRHAPVDGNCTNGEFTLPWIPDCQAEGDYCMEIAVWQPSAPQLRAIDTVAIHVLDRPPDLAVTNVEVQPGTVDRGQSTLVRFTVAEIGGACPVDYPFVTELRWRRPGLNDTLLLSRFRTSLSEGGIILDSLRAPDLSQCGVNEFIVSVRSTEAGRPDSDPSNNADSTDAFVRCPELAVTNLYVDCPVRKNSPFYVNLAVAELNGIDVETQFRGILSIGNNVVLDRMFDPLDAHSSIAIDSIRYQVSVAGSTTLRFEIFPPANQDQDPANNDSVVQCTVIGDPFWAHPNPFTPNGDTYHDTLYFSFGDEGYEDQSPAVDIFDIYGRLTVRLEEVQDQAILWNGRDRVGAECIPGAYYYTLTVGDGTKKAAGLVYVAR